VLGDESKGNVLVYTGWRALTAACVCVYIRGEMRGCPRCGWPRAPFATITPRSTHGPR